MKKRITYIILALTVLVTCGAIFVGFHPASAQEAVSHSSSDLTPAPSGLAPSGPAPAPTPGPGANQVPCDGRSDFLKITSESQGAFCFANAGMSFVSFNDVIKICAGNNNGKLLTRDRGDVEFRKWNCDPHDSDPIQVWGIIIY